MRRSASVLAVCWLAACRGRFDARLDASIPDDADAPVLIDAPIDAPLDAPALVTCSGTVACPGTGQCVSGVCVDPAAACVTTIRYTVRDFTFTPVTKQDGDTRCVQAWPGTHWCELWEMANVDWYPHPTTRHAGDMLGTRQLVYVSDGTGCSGGAVCSNNFENTNTAQCKIPGCENAFCIGEALMCCPD